MIAASRGSNASKALTSYVISLEGTITVAQLLLADGKIEAARELIAFAAIRVRECDITGEVHAERQMREAHTVAKLREAGRLH